MTIPCIEPDWPAPPRVRALSTTRAGGVSIGPYQGLNLGQHVGDDPAAVDANRALVRAHLGGAQLQWLQQVHGTAVVLAGNQFLPEADASWAATPDYACAVMTADCLPVLFCDEAGTRVAAAHAGWRGLCAGVLEATVASMDCAPERTLAWLGPAIGPRAFEVGPEVKAAFVAADNKLPLRVAGEAGSAACFVPSEGRQGAFMADLYALARHRLRVAGVQQLFGGDFCTFSDGARFFSYRRDGQTGRMASLIWLSD
ncbi:laccase domain protein [Halioglobus japonicus]|uniref:peptidoglycan editing factor PgeF n=1 Tax=Halioglobus japonicus TaxID=930805 RepID=UPI0009FD9077|nr:peptidoglycan editing factor PgeF [Halioglobus japonicus]GHD23236.1 laccase domain protein [Halioglobus japonicus]